jgi:DNA polymerase I-like protein with 3'-5' exonuclease and polymerase domains
MTHQLNFIFQQGDWTAPTEFPDLTKHKVVAIDLETRDPNMKKLGTGWARKDGEVVGIAVATADFNGYFPIAHQQGGNMDKKMVLAWFQKQLLADNTKVFHNASYDVGWIKAIGLKINGKIIDTMITAALIDENRFSYSLNNVAKDYLGKLKAETELRQRADEWGVDAKAELWKLPASYVGFYAEQDAQLTLELWNRFQHEIQKQSLNDVWELEMDLLPILIDMREKGVRVDLDGAHVLKKEFVRREKEELASIKKLVGLDVDIWANRSVAKAFDKLGIEYPRTENTKEASFTANWLQNNSEPIAQHIRQARELSKFHSTFIDSIFRHEYNGRIHSEINQLRGDGGGTVSGRLSYGNPNLQQIPARNKELGPRIRALFLPDSDQEQWGSFDYSQQEPRLVVHFASLIGEGYAGSKDLIKAYEQEDADFHQAVADMANIPRSQAKTINLGIMYGMGINKLAKELGIPKNDAEAILLQYKEKVPFVQKLAEKVMSVADSRGYIYTLLGRQCRFNLWEPKTFGLNKAMKEEDAVLQFGRKNIKRAMTYKALNRLIQGSAADQVKKAMVDCAKAGFLPLIQIHDELCFSVKNKEDAKEIKNIMEHCVTMSVPSKVDFEVGPSWGETKPLSDA